MRGDEVAVPVDHLGRLVPEPALISRWSTPRAAQLLAKVCRKTWQPLITVHRLPARARWKWSFASSPVSGPWPAGSTGCAGISALGES